MDYVLMFIAIGVLVPIFFARHKDRIERANYVKLVGFYMMMGFAVLGSAWITGEAMTEPGGSKGVLITVTWALPMVAVSLLAWRVPRVAMPILAIAVVTIIAMSIWEYVDWNWWVDFMDRNGPIITVAVFATAVPIAVYGRFHNAPLASIGLLLIGLVPWLLSSFARGWHSLFSTSSAEVFSSPGVVTGLLFAWSAYLMRKPRAVMQVAH